MYKSDEQQNDRGAISPSISSSSSATDRPTLEKIETAEFVICYDAAQHRVAFSGAIHLRTAGDYDDLRQLLRVAIDRADRELRLDLRELTFLNSSGISALGHFIVEARKAARVPIVIVGSTERPWQARSLATLERIWNKVTLTII